MAICANCDCQFITDCPQGHISQIFNNAWCPSCLMGQLIHKPAMYQRSHLALAAQLEKTPTMCLGCPSYSKCLTLDVIVRDFD
jgi:hypothetical protein